MLFVVPVPHFDAVLPYDDRLIIVAMLLVVLKPYLVPFAHTTAGRSLAR